MTSTHDDLSDLARWAATPLGDPTNWPQSLRVAAQLCLDYPTPCCLVWGEQSHFLYNVSLAESIGPRHPTGMGQPLYDVLPHLWQTIGPIMHEVMRTGRPFAATRFPVQADVGDGIAMFYVDFAFVPVREGDRVVGVFAPVAHTTAAHLEHQHRDVLAAIATVPSAPARVDVAGAIARHLVTVDDVRFAVVFLPDADTGRPVRVATSGAVLRTAATQAALDLAVDRSQWPVEAVMTHPGGPVQAVSAPTAAGPPRPSWESAWLAPFPAGPGSRGVLALGLDERFASVENAPDLVTAFAAAVGERLGRA